MSLRSIFWGSFLLLAGASLISCDRTKSAGDETTAPIVRESVGDDNHRPESEENGSDQESEEDGSGEITLERFEQTYDELGGMYQQMAREHGESGQHMPWGSGAMGQMQRQMEHMSGQCRGMMGRDRKGMMGRNRKGMMGRDHKGMMGRDRRGKMRGQHGRWMNEEWMMSNPAMAQWHEQMANQNLEQAERLEEANEGQRAQTHRKAAKMHRQMAGMMEQMSSGQAGAEPDDDSGESPDGPEIFAAMCASCHGTQGEGASGAFPPLAGNAVVTGPEERLIRIVQEGLTGPLEVDGQTYFGSMPGFQGRLSPTQLAAVLTYIRSSWQNDAGAVSREDVEAATVEDRQRPWTTEELGLAPAN